MRKPATAHHQYKNAPWGNKQRHGQSNDGDTSAPRHSTSSYPFRPEQQSYHPDWDVALPRRRVLMGTLGPVPAFSRWSIVLAAEQIAINVSSSSLVFRDTVLTGYKKQWFNSLQTHRWFRHSSCIRRFITCTHQVDDILDLSYSKYLTYSVLYRMGAGDDCYSYTIYGEEEQAQKLIAFLNTIDDVKAINRPFRHSRVVNQIIIQTSVARIAYAVVERVSRVARNAT